MKIAFTHNLRLSNSETEAEYDSPETVTAITESLRNLGHEVEPIDVSGPASRLVARLEALGPDLVFNTAEGTNGRFREAFYPALFDRLNLPFTFGDAYACLITLDKQLTKMILKRYGIPTPRWIFVDQFEQIYNIPSLDLSFPLIVKPNFEGSSVGITADSIVEDMEQLRTRVVSMLSRFSNGLLIEEFVTGHDIAVPFIENAAPENSGILEAAEYNFKAGEEQKYEIYDYRFKSVEFNSVEVKVPANLSKDQRTELINISKTVTQVLGIRDAGRIDYRIDEGGKIYFIEVNALPSFEEGASIYESAKLAGLESMDKVLSSIIKSASDRFGLSLDKLKRSKKRGKVKVGLTFNLRRTENDIKNRLDAEVEYDSPETVTAVKDAIESYGHEVIELEAVPELPTILPNSGVDVVFNMAEGFEGRNREAQVPALLELLGIPYTGSDPATLSLGLDKALAKKVASQAGIRTSGFAVMMSGKERLPKNLKFPVIVKPLAEGSSKGILKASVVEDEAALRTLVQEKTARYRQAVIAESFLPGREFTVALLGEKRPRVLPVMEVVFKDKSEKFLIYSFESKFFEKNIGFEVPAKISSGIRREIESVARSVFSVLGCRDLARVDLRLDEDGKVNFIECNPLPGLTPGFSDFCVIAEAAGINYRALIGEILAPALRRMREKNKEKVLGGRA